MISKFSSSICLDFWLRCSPSRYITRQDNSPLMEALVLWREAALEKGAPEASSRAVSPAPYSDTEDVMLSGSESRPQRPALQRASTTEDGHPIAPKPSSSSWIRWWSRRTADSTGARPDLRPMSSAPSNLVRPDHALCNDRS